MTPEDINRLFEAGRWMIRFSNNGVGYGVFKWADIGEWTEAPDWNDRPICEGGLFGQSPLAAGYCKAGSRMELCETAAQIAIDGQKVKTSRAKILAVDLAIPEIFLIHLLANGGSLYLRGYGHPLPPGLTSVGGDLYLRGYDHPLPPGLKR